MRRALRTAFLGLSPLAFIAPTASAQVDQFRLAEALRTIAALQGASASAASARPTEREDSAREPESLSVVRRVIQSYRQAATHEKLVVEFRDARGKARRDTLTVHLDPGQEQVDRRIAITLGGLRIHAGRGILTAVSEAAAGRVYRSVIDAELSIWTFARALPPLPVPALDFFLASANQSTPASITAYAKDVVWEREVDRAGLDEGQGLIVRGTGRSSRVQLTVHPTTFRLVRVDISSIDPADPWNLACIAEPISEHEDVFTPQDVVDPGTSDVVDSLAELLATPGRFRAGDRWHGVTLMNADGSVWQRPASGEKPEIFVVYNADLDGMSSVARLRAHELRTRLGESHTIVPLGVGSLVSFGADRTQEAVRHWSDMRLTPAFNASGRLLLDRVCGDADGAIVIVDSQRRIRQIHAIDADAAAITIDVD